MKTPAGWRHIVIDGRDYVWRLSPGSDRHHDPMILYARRAERDAASERLVARGPLLRRGTQSAWRDPCNLGYCRAPDQVPITPREVAEWIREVDTFTDGA